MYVVCSISSYQTKIAWKWELKQTDTYVYHIEDIETNQMSVWNLKISQFICVWWMFDQRAFITPVTLCFEVIKAL